MEQDLYNMGQSDREESEEEPIIAKSDGLEELPRMLTSKVEELVET